MHNPLHAYDSTLEELTAQITDLERRVTILEHERPGTSTPAPLAIYPMAAQFSIRSICVAWQANSRRGRAPSSASR